MHFYSSHAYNFLRGCMTLPHPRTVRSWTAEVNAEAGFTMETLRQIQVDVNKVDHQVYVALMFDEMAISGKQILMEKKLFDFMCKCNISFCFILVIGYHDIGSSNYMSEKSVLAKEALVFYCKAINASWKHPIGYHLISGLDACTKMQLVIKYLVKLEEVGVRVATTTCDGTSTSVLNSFGIQVDTSSNCTFTYETELNKSGKIRGILDPAHMLKLLRNLLSDEGILYNGEGRKIQWKYLVMLNDLQKQQGLHCGNKLRDKHIYFQNQKMKVNITAQTLSNSVANALLFLKNVLQRQEYTSC
uniref:THAP domain-containing protein 9 n=1 Tax=Photinus pyralis TaxID=7054 RepID=A0A1Y1MYQ2_PHOPY